MKQPSCEDRNLYLRDDFIQSIIKRPDHFLTYTFLIFELKEKLLCEPESVGVGFYDVGNLLRVAATHTYCYRQVVALAEFKYNAVALFAAGYGHA